MERGTDGREEYSRVLIESMGSVIEQEQRWQRQSKEAKAERGITLFIVWFCGGRGASIDND